MQGKSKLGDKREKEPEEGEVSPLETPPKLWPRQRCHPGVPSPQIPPPLPSCAPSRALGWPGIPKNPQFWGPCLPQNPPPGRGPEEKQKQSRKIPLKSQFFPHFWAIWGEKGDGTEGNSDFFGGGNARNSSPRPRERPKVGARLFWGQKLGFLLPGDGRAPPAPPREGDTRVLLFFWVFSVGFFVVVFGRLWFYCYH